MILGCDKENTDPYNPYDDIIYDIGNVYIDSLNNHSIIKVHRDVFAPKCNVLGCHDGSFEPDFRTVQSSFNTLVYHPIIKNNLDSDFVYRVIPYDTANSVLHERITNCCFVNIDDRMPQDNIGISMPQESIDLISNWILNGAQDIFGNINNSPNELRSVLFSIVTNITFDSIYSDNRLDNKYYKPFLLPQNEMCQFIFKVYDDITTPDNLQYNKLKISTYPDDFTNAVEYSISNFDLTNEVWFNAINTADFDTAQQYFMRYYVNDGENIENTEYPNNNFSIIYKSIWSFIIQ